MRIRGDNKPTYLGMPTAWPLYIVLLVLFVAVVGLLGLDVLSYAYEKIGISPGWLFSVLAASVLGSFVNIPVGSIRNRTQPQASEYYSFMGMRFRIPAPIQASETRISVNVGGAVIPVALSGYLILHDHLLAQALVGAVVVAFAVHLLARPIRGIGIGLPIILPALIAVVVASILTVHYLAALAYIVGVLGVLFGADISNLSKTRQLGASSVSFGGAGTFDGIFLTGIIAALIAII